jgi:hypothetical protein
MLVQHSVNLIRKEISSLEKVGFLFDFICRNNLPLEYIRGELFTTSNCQVSFFCTQNLIRLANASNWPTSCCCKKVKKLLTFILTQ